MSRRVASPPANVRRAAIAKSLLILGLLTAGGLIATAQQPRDDTPPLPPAEPNRAIRAQKYQIPNKDRRIFQGQRDPKTLQQVGGIVDLTAIAAETDSSDEYHAWHEVTVHAAQFNQTELAEHAARDLTRDDLVTPQGPNYRLELLRFAGKIAKVRRVPATRSLREVGIAEVYEAHVVPIDEPPTDPISLVFTELPEALAGVKQTSEKQWMAVDSWGIATGFFFKVKLDAPGDVRIPVLIGKSVTMLKEPPAGPDKNSPAALDKSLRVYKFIRDDYPIARGDENWEEVSAWNRVLLHACRFSPEELEAGARTDLAFHDLFKDVRRDYKLELVKFEGRLIKLSKMEPSKKLRDAGITTAFEGWLSPKDEPSGNPICIVFTEAIEGVNPEGRVNKWVTFAGYSFKLMRYESGEKDKKDPARNTWKKAPLLLGRAAIVRPDPEGASNVSWQSFTTVATAVVLSLLGAALALTWLFRRGDKGARREIEANRAKNPFGEPTN